MGFYAHSFDEVICILPLKGYMGINCNVLVKDFWDVREIGVAVFIILELAQKSLNISFINLIRKLFKHSLQARVEVLGVDLIIIKLLASKFQIFLDVILKVFLIREVSLKSSGYLLTSFEDAFQLVYRLELWVEDIEFIIC